MAKNRCWCGELRHKHDVEQIEGLQQELEDERREFDQEFKQASEAWLNHDRIHNTIISQLESELDRLEKENNRLREALRAVANEHADWPDGASITIDIVRDALREKGDDGLSHDD